MFHATKLIVLKLLVSKGRASVSDVKDIIIRKVQVLTPIVYNESPFEIEEEFRSSIELINMQTDGCIKFDNSAAYIANSECREKLKQMLNNNIKEIKTSTDPLSRALQPLVDAQGGLAF